MQDAESGQFPDTTLKAMLEADGAPPMILTEDQFGKSCYVELSPEGEVVLADVKSDRGESEGPGRKIDES